MLDKVSKETYHKKSAIKLGYIMKVHIWIDKNDVSDLANGKTDIDFWYRKPSFPNKKSKETVMVSISADTFQALLDNDAIDDIHDDPFLEAFGD
jgi:hypothetical protein